MKRVQIVFGVSFAVLAIAVGLGQGTGPALTSDVFKDLQFRSLGPSLTTGRVADVAVDPKNPSVWYVASAAGGVWKTDNRGQTFKPIFDDGGAFNLSCIVIDPKDSNVLWLGTGENSNPRSAMYGDGVYKSTDAGATWTRVGLEGSEHIGNIRIDPRNSNVVYVAAQGPLWNSGGDRGLYKTMDGGKTWKMILPVQALPDTGANEIQIDPLNPDILYASLYQRRRSIGQFIGGGPEGGIYKSLNAGVTWTKLTKGLPDNVGRIALGTDPKAKPTRVYALIDAVGAEQGFYRSDDAGASWTRMGQPTGTDTAPAAPGAAAAPPANAARGGAARGGAARGGAAGGAAAGAAAGGAAAGGAQAGGAGAGGGRPGGPAGGAGFGGAANPAGQDPHYYYEIFVDPTRPDTVWGEGLNMYRTDDGGKTFHAVQMQYNSAIHVDFHAIAFDLNDKNHWIFGNDGGLYETWDEGKNVRHFDNLPISQFYRIAVDNALPFYHVCGGLQDNNSMCGPSRSINAYGIRTGDWYLVGGGDGFQPRIDPEDPNTVYATSQFCGLGRLDLRTSQNKGIRPTTFSSGDAPTQPVGAPAGGGRGGGRGGTERVNWDCAYMISPHSHTRLYIGGEKVYRSDDRGDTWTPISPNLTRDLDPRVIPIMGKVWDTATTVSYNRSTTQLSTIVSIDESPLLEGLIYVGTDDGLVQVTEDGGKNWRKTDKFPGAPDGAYVSDVWASARDSNVVFITIGNHQHGDFKPYVLRSDDRGKTFTSITGDLPASRNNLWSVAQDHVNGNLLFVGGEFGLFFTVDGGHHWMQMKGGLPITQVRDIHIQKRENDLVIGTFGRGIYVLDDYSALREATPDMTAEEARLLPIRTTYAYNEYRLAQASTPMVQTPNPPVGALISYYVSAADTGHLVLTITDENGKQIRRIDPITQGAGVHRLTWNLRPDAPTAPPAGGAGGGRGAGGGGRGGFGLPMVDPGHYVATLGKLDGDKVTPIGKPQSFYVVPLPAKNW